jgi:hypothetical protein
MWKVGDKVFVRYLEGQVFRIVAIKDPLVRLKRVHPTDISSITFDIPSRDVVSEPEAKSYGA